jgi:hypothetical protein
MLAYLWGGQKWGDRVENEDPELAMRADLDAHGEFVCKLDGIMEFTDFLTMRSCIAR